VELLKQLADRPPSLRLLFSRSWPILIRQMFVLATWTPFFLASGKVSLEILSLSPFFCVLTRQMKIVGRADPSVICFFGVRSSLDLPGDLAFSTIRRACHSALIETSLFFQYWMTGKFSR